MRKMAFCVNAKMVAGTLSVLALCTWLLVSPKAARSEPNCNCGNWDDVCEGDWNPGCPWYTASTERKLTKSELNKCALNELSLLRNWIYARHGRIFKCQALQCLFECCTDYKPNPNNPTGEKGITKMERSNINLISSVEKAKGGPQKCPQ